MNIYSFTQFCSEDPYWEGLGKQFILMEQELDDPKDIIRQAKTYYIPNDTDGTEVYVECKDIQKEMNVPLPVINDFLFKEQLRKKDAENKLNYINSKISYLEELKSKGDLNGK